MSRWYFENTKLDLTARAQSPKAVRLQPLGGAPETNRTSDQRFRKPLLYPLSYGGESALLADAPVTRNRRVEALHAASMVISKDSGRISPCSKRSAMT